MIEQLFTEYSPLQLPFETQYRLAFGVSLFVFLMAAFIRETVKSPGWRWMARFAGAAAFFAIAGYAKYTTEEIKELSNELQARKTEHASPVVSAVASMVFEVATPNGTQISWGGAGPLSVTGRRSLGNYFGDRSGFENAAREIHAADDLQNGADDANEVTQGSPRKF
jgi:hypothetical protein